MPTGFGLPGRPRWYLAAGAAAGVTLLAGIGAALVMFSPAPAPRPLADQCGLVTCGASLPPPVMGQAVRSTPRAVRRHHPARQSPAAPMHSATPQPSATPPQPRPSPTSPAPSPHQPPQGPQVTVAYTLDGGDHWHHSFRAHLTIVNNGHREIAGWTIQLSLPGDRVGWVGYPGAWQPFTTWWISGHVLVMHAVSGGETLPAGGTRIVPIFADGVTTSPRSCTFDGSACQS